MNDEIPYNPPGMDEYRREGARKNSELLRKHALLKSVAAVKDGFGGVLPNGNVVDRREHPEAIPIPENHLMDTPKPKKVDGEGILQFTCKKCNRVNIEPWIERNAPVLAKKKNLPRSLWRCESCGELLAV